MSRKILKHPDKEEIISMLNDGESVRGVEAKLKKKYGEKKARKAEESGLKRG